MSEPIARVISVKELLAKPNLLIPSYQRPYKWTTKNVSQLLEDIANMKDTGRYRLGSIIVHLDGTNLNIVDGQQRTISLALISLAVRDTGMHLKNEVLKTIINEIEKAGFDPDFEENRISATNIYHNYQEIKRAISTYDEETLIFLFEKCEVVLFEIVNLSEAFQFFDSQNARGKDLDPHDLLKAYHLREFSPREESLKLKKVYGWENTDPKELSTLFGEYLFRIRGWANGYPSRWFSKNQIDMFKGINLENGERYPYSIIYRMAHVYTDTYNSKPERSVDGNSCIYPFQLDQTIINGRLFFEMVDYYTQKKAVVESSLKSSNLKNVQAIIETLNTYPARTRTGDRYVRMLFDCALLFYHDKFGEKELDRIVIKLFIWAYTVRLTYKNVQLPSVDNYVLENTNMFRLIRGATSPADILCIPITTIENKISKRTDEIENLFTRFGYNAK